MSLYRKSETGQIIKTAGNLVQRFNDRIFLTTHSVEGGADYYDIELAAKKYILQLTSYTEYQLYIDTPNTTDNVRIRYQGKTLQLRRSDNDPIAVGALNHRINLYTLDITTNEILMDPLLQPTPDTYRGLFTYALNTWNVGLISDPVLDQTAVALDTNLTYKYDGSTWNLVGPIDDPATGQVIEPLNGWYWMIEYFPNYNFGNGKIVWNGATNSWNVFTARVPRPDEVTIVTDPSTNKFLVNPEKVKTKIFEVNTTVNPTLTVGQAGWNSAEQTLHLKVSEHVDLPLGRAIISLAKNVDTVPLTDGMVVYISGAVVASGVIEVKRALATMANANSVFAVVTEPIAINAIGNVTQLGNVNQLNTDAFNEGDQLYLSSDISGGLTNILPSYPSRVVRIGTVIRNHSTTGIINVNIDIECFAEEISFDNSATDLTSTNIEGAIIELDSKIGDIDAVLDLINGEVI